DKTRFALSVAAFNRISNYDGAISDYLSSIQEDGARSLFPAQSNGRFVKLQDLRYGENPHQQAAFYRDLHPAPGSLVTARQLQGKELSYNNIADADAAWECVKSFSEPACVIVKHANPCGVAIAADPLAAYGKAFQTDPTSAFGGIIAFNRALDRAAAEEIGKQFTEVILAPRVEPAAREFLATKQNLRVLEVPLSHDAQAHDYKRVGGGLLVQSSDAKVLERKDLVLKTRKQPAESQWTDLLFAWKVAKFVKSNAIVFCRDGATLGVGAGQMSRIDSARIAAIKAKNAGLELAGSVAASDAFFPFRDGLDCKLSQSPRVQKVFVLLGNGAAATENGLENLPLSDFSKLVDFCRKEQ